MRAYDEFETPIDDRGLIDELDQVLLSVPKGRQNGDPHSVQPTRQQQDFELGEQVVRVVL